MVPNGSFVTTVTRSDAKEPAAVAHRMKRRRHRRIDALGRCFAQIGGGWEGSVLNLSASGLLMRLRRGLNPGSSYILKVFLDGQVLVVEARVVRVARLDDECFAGMEFLGMSAEDAALVRRYLRR